jgi:putative membrane protein
MMPRLLRPLAGLAALLLAAPAFAQSGNPAVVTPGTPELAPGQPAPSTVNAADRLFLQQAAIGGMAEVELAEFVLSRSHNTEVEAFADRMKADHGQANAELKSIADAAGMKLPTTLDADHRAVRERLATISNQAFDLAYLQGQLVDHQKTAQLLTYVIGSGQDPMLKAFASKNLPIVLEHLHLVQELQTKLAGKAA